MSFYHGRRLLPHRFRLVLASVLQPSGLPLSDVLTEDEIEEAFDEEEAWFAQEDGDVFTPAVTLWAFLSQVLHKEEQRSCLAAVSRVIVLLAALGRQPCANNSGGYCKARAKLSEVVILRLATGVAVGCEKQVSEDWLWKGRHVKLADGTTVSMPDTEENQEEYPQQASQEEGLGFPVARMVLLLSLATAMVCGMAIGPYSGKETGELALMRQLLDQLDAGDILLTDKYFCSYFMIALLLERDIDFVARLHHARKEDAYRTKRLGKKDYLIVWQRPLRPTWMTQETYDRIPKSLTLRQVEVNVTEPGFRVESLVIVTTLTDVEQYSRDDIAELYHRRWLAELDIRAIKCNLGMDVLRCKSPEMVRKEIWTCLLAYNLIRRTMLQAAMAADLSPRQLSFANGMQTMAASWVVLPALDQTRIALVITMQLASLTSPIVGKRPNRIEPRAVKRRPKPIRLLNMTRDAAREKLLSGIDPYKRRR
ncbi:MAG: IS4 family transposase [Pirellulales bacterium]